MKQIAGNSRRAAAAQLLIATALVLLANVACSGQPSIPTCQSGNLGGSTGTDPCGTGGNAGSGGDKSTGGVSATGGLTASGGTSNACVPIGAEDCYNDQDDDCNGLVDCEDPACTPIAECVEDANSFQLGTEVAVTSACPTAYTNSSTVVNQGLTAPPACNGCSCTPTLACTSTLFSLAAAPCPGGTKMASYNVSDASCTNNGSQLNITTGAIHVDPITPVRSCLASGTPNVATPGWTSSTQFCQTVRIGGGCPSGNVCVPKLGTSNTKHCALAAGAQSCPGNYVPAGGNGAWYTGFNDTRSCGATCTCSSPSGGSCGTSFVRGYLTNTVCAGASDTLVPNMDNCSLDTPINSAKVVLQGIVQPTCVVANAATGTATPTGQQTLCCL